MSKVSDETIEYMLEMMKLLPNGTHAVMSKENEVGAWLFNCETTTSILEELKNYRLNDLNKETSNE